MDFCENLKWLIDDSGKKLADIANDLQITPQTLYSYLAGKTIPEYKYLILLADYFKCSIDYLIGKEEREIIFKKPPPFNQNLKQVLETKKISGYKLCKETAISKSILHEWLSGKSVPSSYNLIKLAIYFDCSIDYLVGRES